MEVLFRCDANAETGRGHLSRCISLAEAFREMDVSATFMGLFDGNARVQLSQAGFDCIGTDSLLANDDTEMERLRGFISRSSAPFIVIDSYRADAGYLAMVRGCGCPVAIFDDFHALESYPCDVVLNFTWSASADDYPDGPVKLLGPQYFPARRGLVSGRTRSLERSRSGPVRTVLIAIGGADPERIASRLVRLLTKHSDLSVRVVTEADAELAQQLALFAEGSGTIWNLPDLAEQMVWADACITGGGLTKYEAAFLGLPIATIAQNQGQADETATLAAEGLVFDLGMASAQSDQEIEAGLDVFLDAAELRSRLMAGVRSAFPADPSLRAAQAIIGAVENIS